jgi:hypothetical protein
MLGKGKIKEHLSIEFMPRGLTTVEIFQCHYNNDGEFIFLPQNSMTQGLTLVHKQFGQLGLEIHIRQGTTPPRTKYIFFPSPALLAHKFGSRSRKAKAAILDAPF